MIYDVTKYGIIGDGVSNNTQKIKELIDVISKNGGGKLYFPAGKYVTGSVILKSNMTLYLENGAVILGSEDEKDYGFLENQDISDYCRKGRTAIICAFNAENVAICGHGTIDGRGKIWWEERRNSHRPRSVQFILCKNVKIEDITIINSPMWTVNPTCCENVNIRGISIENPATSPNTDGINPESCKNVHISDCTINVGDDCLTLKSGTENEPLMARTPCENITVTNCTMINGHGGVVIGSEMTGGVKNVVISNCIFNGTDRGIRIKTRRKRKGTVERILISGIVMDNVNVPVVINEYYRCGTDRTDQTLFTLEKLPVADDLPTIKDINISNLLVRNARLSAMYMLGIPEKPIESVVLSNIDIEMKNDGSFVDEPIMSAHRIDTCGNGIHIENAKNIKLSKINVTTAFGEKLELVNCENIETE